MMELFQILEMESWGFITWGKHDQGGINLRMTEYCALTIQDSILIAAFISLVAGTHAI